MTDTPTDPRLPGRTTPTWDMELLVSGASVFALLQVPGWIDEAFFALMPRLDMALGLLARIFYTYSKIAVLVLAGAFALHLVLRAYWIALVGMHSIYPDGVRWDELKVGPRQRRAMRGFAGAMADRIERADNRASVVFALGITTALVMAGVMGLMTLAYVATVVLHRASGWDWVMPNGLMIFPAIGFAPYFLAHAVDRSLGARLADDSRTARLLDAVFAAYARVGIGRGDNPTMLLLQSHPGARPIVWLNMAAVFLCAMLAGAQMVAQQRSLAFGDYARWPAARAGHADSLVAAHYRDQAPPATSLLPTIDSQFPGGDYLTLVVPFDPQRHPDELAKACPQAWEADATPARRHAVLACLGRWIALRLDGQPLPSARVRFYDDPRTGQQSAAVVVPIRALAAGEHELALRNAGQALRRHPQPATYRIVFWR